MVLEENMNDKLKNQPNIHKRKDKSKRRVHLERKNILEEADLEGEGGRMFVFSFSEKIVITCRVKESESSSEV
jgi:hypothetical protein